jgi:two-component system OmpR family sensor kinase
MAIKSIRRQLLLWLLGLLVAAGLAVAAGLYVKLRAEANELFDYDLQQMALSLRDQVLEQGSATIPNEPQYDFVIQIWDRAGVRIYLSNPHSVLPNRAQLGFTTVMTSEGAWRVFSVELRDRVIQVAQPLRVRERLAAQQALRTLLPFTLVLPILGVLIWVIVGRGLRPLDQVAHAVSERSARALTPLSAAGLPVEVRPLVQALNDLLARLGHSIEAQRNFVADAAHELRTPLTAVQLQLQLAERAKTDEERELAFAQLREGLKRTIHLVQQLLTLARQEPDFTARPFAPVDLSELTRQVVGELTPFAVAKDIDLGVSRLEPAIVNGDAEGLRVMLSNLIDNAIRYIPRDGKIDVAITREAGAPVLSVTDNGPGIPPEERERVLDRFYRREGTGVAGSGLGLTIVKNVAARHGAVLALADGDGGVGLRVSVRFPSAAAAVQRAPGED